MKSSSAPMGQLMRTFRDLCFKFEVLERISHLKYLSV